MVVSIVLALALVFSVWSNSARSPTGFAVLSPEEASRKAVDWITNFYKANGIDINVTLVNASRTESGLYEFTVMFSTERGDETATYYVTEDGKLFLPQAIPTNYTIEVQNKTEEKVAKSERPEAHAFIMSYCPYGLQFLKAYIPVIELLGKKADLEINFVNYIMHGKKELDENTRMYCIQKEQRDKLTKYLRCFVASDNYTKCINEAGIDKTKLESCINMTDKQFNITGLYNDNSTWLNGRFPLYPVDDKLNEKYGVGGSPTFVINGKTISVARSAEAIKQAICSAFIDPPAECNQTLSTTTEATGIGAIGAGSGSSSGGQC